MARTDTLSLSPLEILQPLLGFERELSTRYYPEVAYEFVLQLLLIFQISLGSIWFGLSFGMIVSIGIPHVKWCCSTRNTIIDFALYILNITLVLHTLQVECLSLIWKGNTFTSLKRIFLDPVILLQICPKSQTGKNIFRTITRTTKHKQSSILGKGSVSRSFKRGFNLSPLHLHHFPLAPYGNFQ